MFGIVGLWLLLLLNNAAVCGVLLAVLARLFSQDQPRGRHVEEGLLVLEVMGCLRNFDALSSMYTIQIRSAAHAPFWAPRYVFLTLTVGGNCDAAVRFPTHAIFRPRSRLGSPAIGGFCLVKIKGARRREASQEAKRWDGAFAKSH